MTRRVPRRVITIVAIAIVVLLAGATYQGVATALERRQYPRPGGLVDVGGHQLHIHCTGEGSPAVVLEAPAMGLSAAWGWIQPDVAKTTRVCSYDRAGLGWSEAGDSTFDPARVAPELRALLAQAGVKPPYVLAGHGLGASFAEIFAAKHPDVLAGLVFIDPPHIAAPENISRTRVSSFVRLVSVSPWLARAGVLRATRMLSDEANGLPPESEGAVRAFLNRPDHLTRASRELAKWNEVVGAASDARQLNVRPAIVVRSSDPEPTAFLTDRAEAAKVTAAILDTVSKARNAR
jgi:pimeloyl-ACP methyl ester carboxylesterase